MLYRSTGDELPFDDPYITLKGANFAIDMTLEFEIAVTLVEAGSLPRFDAKGARFDDQRENDES